MTAGVYCFASSAQIDMGASFTQCPGERQCGVQYIQIGGALTTALSSARQVTIINGGTGNNVIWQVGGSATLRTNHSQFAGDILALFSNITHALDTGARYFVWQEEGSGAQRS